MQNCRDSNQSLAQTHSAMQLLDLNYFLLDISVFLLVIHSYHCSPILDHVFAVFFVLLVFFFYPNFSNYTKFRPAFVTYVSQPLST